MLPCELVRRIEIPVAAPLNRRRDGCQPRVPREVDASSPVIIGIDDTVPVGAEGNGVDRCGLAIEYGVLFCATVAVRVG